MKTSLAARRLDRVLAALAEELVVATDVEIREACEDLGIDPTMKGSAAFAGLRHLDSLRVFRSYFRAVAEQRRQALADADGPRSAKPKVAAKAARKRARPSGARRGRGGARSDDDG